jgi:oligopeptide transport system substrate-binding protein
MLRLLIICLALVGLLAATLEWSIGRNDTPADFIFVNRGDHKTLDLGQINWLQDIRVAYSLWEGLYTLDPVTLRSVPGVAERMEVNPARTVYTFYLRHNARWSNGDPVTTHDFLFAWRRMLEEPAEYTFLHFYIKGARQYEEAYADWVDQADKGNGLTRVPPPDYGMVGIKAIDDYTLVVTLRNPIPFFLDLCAFPPFYPQHEPSMRPFAQVDPHTGRVASYDEGFTRPPHLVSNGPYRLDEWIFKRKLRFVANDYYWNRASVHFRVIDEPEIDDPLAAFRAYLSGQVDCVFDVDEDLIGQMRQAGGFPDLHIFPVVGTYYYVYNCLPKLPGGRPNPLADMRVRQALSMAIDKRPITEHITKANQRIADHLIPPDIFQDYPSPPGLPFDVERARRLLAEAGYPGGRGFPLLQMIYNKEFTQHGDIALVLHNQWRTNLGINIDMQQLEIKVYAERFFRRDFDIARGSWIGDYADPTTFTDKFQSDNDDNNPGWANKKYDALCAAAETETDLAKRMKILAQAEAILLQESPILPLYHYVAAYLYHNDIHGMALDPREAIMLSAVQKR